ncbi:hypothetical protein ACFE04_006611 [Oxalis oulophora]
MVVLVAHQDEAAVEVLVSRTGRHLQRYNKGLRQVVGCIPYRYNKVIKNSSLKNEDQELQVLLISSQKGKGMLFPKGGWELDETKKQAAIRETIEEAGVRGVIKGELGKWNFKSKTHDTCYEGFMFPLLVTEQLDIWPERKFRQRIWMSVPEARKTCQHPWMKEALDVLTNRLTLERPLICEADVKFCSLSQ